MAVLVFTWIDGVLCTGVCILSAQRITFAIARDGILPFSKIWSRVTTGHHLPVNACILVAVLCIAIDAAVIGSYVAFYAITAAATVGTNLSYLIPILARQTVGRKDFQPAKWNLGRYSMLVSVIASGYIMFLFVVLMLPQIYPVTPVCEDIPDDCMYANESTANIELCAGSQRCDCHYRARRMVLSIWAWSQVLVLWTEANDLSSGGAAGKSER